LKLNWIEKFEKLPEFVFPTIIFVVLIFFGLINYSDYGLSWDEPAQRRIGEISYNYLFKGDNSLKDFHDADYGVGIELPLFIIEKALNLKESKEIFQMRHLVSHLFFLICLIFGYLLIHALYNNKWLALVGVLFFVLNPIIYAHSFFNTKDIPFMAMYLVSFYFIFKAFSSYKWSMFLLAGIATGFLMNLRIMGILLVLFVVGFITVDILSKWKEKEYRIIALKSILLFLLAFFITLYVSWPYLYEHPIDHLVKAFKNMSKFRWDGQLLYFGDLIMASNLPWHYGITWMIITTPLVYIALGFAGLLVIFFRLILRPIKIFHNGIERHLLIYLLCFIAPFVAVIVFKSILYDGWRHLYFVYPPFVMLAVYCLHKIEQTKFFWVGTSVILLAFVGAFWFMSQNHPHQQTYFNALVNRGEPEQVRHQFDLDYWGVSYLHGIKAILVIDESPVIEMKMNKNSGVNNLLLLPQSVRNRIKVTNENPKYFLTEYRTHPNDYPFTAEQEVYSIKVDNNTILSVFKLRD